MASSHYEMVKESLIRGLKNANFDVKKFSPASIRAGFFTDQVAVKMAESAARLIATRLRKNVERGQEYSPAILEKEVDYMAAESGLNAAIGAINIYMASGQNVSKYVKDGRECLAILRKHDRPETIYIEKRFYEHIGEE